MLDPLSRFRNILKLAEENAKEGLTNLALDEFLTDQSDFTETIRFTSIHDLTVTENKTGSQFIPR